jgi:hypothetical protein
MGMAESDEFDDLLGGPAPIVVELDAYVIPDDHLVFKLTPGKTYRFYRAVHAASAVFMDIRGLEQLPEDPSNWDDKEVLKIIAADRWDREVKSRERGNKPTESGPEINRTDKRNLTFLKRLLFEGKEGDLVVVGAAGYIADVLIGEFTTAAKKVRKIVAKDGEEQHVYIGRAVHWRAAVEKRLLPTQLIDAVHRQTAIFVMGRSLREDVYALAYRNFVYEGRFGAEFHVEKTKFTAEDSAVVSTWFNGFDVVRNAIEDGEPSRLTGKSFLELGLSPLDDGKAAELTININSPGEFTLRSVTPFALALMAMLPLAACDSKKVIDNGVTIQMKTVGSATNGCALEVEKTVKEMVETMSYKRLQEACNLAHRAMNDAKVSTRARLKDVAEGSK